MDLCNLRRLSVLCLVVAAVFADFQEDVFHALQCLESQHISSLELREDIEKCYKEQLDVGEALSPMASFQTVIKKACSIKDPKYCITKNTEVLRLTCLTTPSLVEVFAKAMRTLDVAYEYVCLDDGKRIIEFYNSGGAQCVFQIFGERGNVTKCIQTHFEFTKKELEALGDNQQKTHELECSFFNQIKTCITDGMTLCPKPKEILAGFLEVVYESQCGKNNSSEAGAQAATPISQPTPVPGSSGMTKAPFLLTFLLSFLLLLLRHL